MNQTFDASKNPEHKATDQIHLKDQPVSEKKRTVSTRKQCT